MSANCTASCEAKPKTLKHTCPVCGQAGLEVPLQTILLHIKEPWLYRLSDTPYFFCRSTDCVVAYFSKNDDTINKSNLRTKIGIKEKTGNALICFCFGVNKTVAATDNRVKEFVITQTKASTCACESANPSGRCCLKDFPK